MNIVVNKPITKRYVGILLVVNLVIVLNAVILVVSQVCDVGSQS